MEGRNGIANRSYEAVHPCPKLCLKAYAVPCPDTQEVGGNKTQATTSAKATKEAAFPKVGS